MFFGFRSNFRWGTENLVGRIFQIAWRGKGKILFPQCSGMIILLGGFFIGWWESDEEWFWLLRKLLFSGGNKLFVGRNKNLVGRESTGGRFFLVEANEETPIPTVVKTLGLTGFPFLDGCCSQKGQWLFSRGRSSFT